MFSVFNEHHGEIHVAGVKQKRGSNDGRRSQREKWDQTLRSLLQTLRTFALTLRGMGQSWKIPGRERMWSALCLNRISLAAALGLAYLA